MNAKLITLVSNYVCIVGKTFISRNSACQIRNFLFENVLKHVTLTYFLSSLPPINIMLAIASYLQMLHKTKDITILLNPTCIGISKRSYQTQNTVNIELAFQTVRCTIKILRMDIYDCYFNFSHLKNYRIYIGKQNIDYSIGVQYYKTAMQQHTSIISF